MEPVFAQPGAFLQDFPVHQENFIYDFAAVGGIAFFGGKPLVSPFSCQPHGTDGRSGRFQGLFPGEEALFACALEELVSKLAGQVREPLLPIRLNTIPEWLAGSGM